MKSVSCFRSGIVFACICWPTITAAPRDNVQLNQGSVRFAEQLIETGHFVADKKGGWRDHRPSSDEENQFIRTHGIAEYAKWHLGIDERHSENTKAGYKFPFGDFKNVHRSALIAISSRARQYGYAQIENAAIELQRRLEQKAKPAR